MVYDSYRFVPELSMAPSPPLNPILDVFRDLRIRDSRYLQTNLSAPWGLRINGYAPHGVFHFMAEGGGVIRLGAESFVMERGDFALLPRGDDHELLDAPGSRAQSLEALPYDKLSDLGCAKTHGGGGVPTLLISGTFTFEPHPVVRELPNTLFIRRSEEDPSSDMANLGALLESLIQEVTNARPGAETIVNRLTDVLVIRSVRGWLDTARGERGWLAALRQDGLGRALALIHTDAERAWTVEELASQAGMSRSTFLKKFSERVGTTPIQLLNERRMQLASRWLRDDALSISEVSTRLGYSSDAAFSRAFKRYMGTTPGAVARGLA